MLIISGNFSLCAKMLQQPSSSTFSTERRTAPRWTRKAAWGERDAGDRTQPRGASARLGPSRRRPTGTRASPAERPRIAARARRRAPDPPPATAHDRSLSPSRARAAALELRAAWSPPASHEQRRGQAVGPRLHRAGAAQHAPQRKLLPPVPPALRLRCTRRVRAVEPGAVAGKQPPPEPQRSVVPLAQPFARSPFSPAAPPRSRSTPSSFLSPHLAPRPRRKSPAGEPRQGGVPPATGMGAARVALRCGRRGPARSPRYLRITDCQRSVTRGRACDA